ncbi:hypothetical protein EW145_g4766 [Phellinidium pouzarii]|uniref:sn-1-specific diacylglycerol lipase n=1 Tax=Phellinidium pouzarii TaxID=167371 RepID=A0A4S4L2D3_9AGAM|nr:hypothetical protein EW145_g4766 [Phellinidium pouzarii]
MSKWESYSRFGLGIVSTATSVGFSAAKMGTKLGFGIARGVTSTVVGIAGSPFGVGPVLGGAVSVVFTLAEHVALAPILIGETLTSTSLVAAESSIDVLSAMFPGSDEASFSLASFVALVKREWNNPVLREQLPRERYSITEIGKALIAWGSLQGVTHEWKENSWFKVLKEIDVNDVDDQSEFNNSRRESRIRITSDAFLPRDIGQIITAEIEDADPSFSKDGSFLSPTPSLQPRVSQYRLKANLRRFSKMVLAGYGGAGLIFFGVSFTPPSPSPTSAAPNPLHENAQTSEEHALADAIDASEREASSSFLHPAPAPEIPDKAYSWWNVLLGRHDREIFEGYAFTPASVRETGRRRHRRASVGKEFTASTENVHTAIVGSEKYMPRYWVLTDHGRRQVVLVFRGTMSFNELAVDLTCDPEPFAPAHADDISVMDMPGSLPFPSKSPPTSPKRKRASEISEEELEEEREVYDVHGGMLRMARVMGARGKPVHRAVRQALHKNKGYGHSLGAGVAALLALTWANPETCLTVPSSGLPVGRRVTAYCFAPPCLVSPALSTLSNKLITSFVYSHDVVSRLSLGSVRDMNRAASWLCEANKANNVNKAKGEGYTAVTKRAMKWHAGYGSLEDPDWFLSVRKTLEANMIMADLFPPGRVLWAIRDGDLHPSHRLSRSNSSTGTTAGVPEDKVRLFEVLDVERMFGQIVFARDMLRRVLLFRVERYSWLLTIL